MNYLNITTHHHVQKINLCNLTICSQPRAEQERSKCDWHLMMSYSGIANLFMDLARILNDPTFLGLSSSALKSCGREAMCNR